MLQTTQLGDFRAACEEAIRGAQTRATQLERSLQGAAPEPKGGEKTKRTPYGFDVDKGRRLVANEAALMKRMNDVAQNAANAQEWCVSNGVPIIGILPEDVWLKICASRQLFTFWMNPRGDAQVSNTALDKAQSEIYDRVKDRNIFGMRRSYEMQELLRVRMKRAITRRFFERRNRVSMLLDLFPDFGQSDLGYSARWVPIRFPEPPEDFGKALLKLDGLRQRIAVVVEADAVNIDQYVAETLADIDEKVSDLEGKRREVRREAFREFFTIAEPDPILTFKTSFHGHEEGPVRVIVAQYGKWPLELAAMKRAIEEDLSQIPG
jgi:hypothetical protein